MGASWRDLARGPRPPAHTFITLHDQDVAIAFPLADLDATFERVRASGAENIQEPIDMFYGVRDCAFRDPSGNHLRVSQKPS